MSTTAYPVTPLRAIAIILAYGVLRLRVKNSESTPSTDLYPNSLQSILNSCSTNSVDTLSFPLFFVFQLIGIMPPSVAHVER